MLRRNMLIGLAGLTLAACGAPRGTIGPDGLPLPQRYNIGPNDTNDIQFRLLDGVNALRQAAGAPPVALDPQLIAAATTHSRDMSRQNRPWLFGSDGSSPLDRARRAGFQGRLLGENISESYETELETLSAWMTEANSRAVILDPDARRLGLGWFQEDAGKLWWTMNLGSDPTLSRAVTVSASPSFSPQG